MDSIDENVVLLDTPTNEMEVSTNTTRVYSLLSGFCIGFAIAAALWLIYLALSTGVGNE